MSFCMITATEDAFAIVVFLSVSLSTMKTDRHVLLKEEKEDKGYNGQYFTPPNKTRQRECEQKVV